MRPSDFTAGEGLTCKVHTVRQNHSAALRRSTHAVHFLTEAVQAPLCYEAALSLPAARHGRISMWKTLHELQFIQLANNIPVACITFNRSSSGRAPALLQNADTAHTAVIYYSTSKMMFSCFNLDRSRFWVMTPCSVGAATYHSQHLRCFVG